MASRFIVYRLPLRTIGLILKKRPVHSSTRSGLHLTPLKTNTIQWNKEFRRDFTTVKEEDSLFQSEDDKSDLNLNNSLVEKYSLDDKKFSDINDLFEFLRMKSVELGFINMDDIEFCIENIENGTLKLQNYDYFKLLEITLFAVKKNYKYFTNVVHKVWNLHEGRKDVKHFELYLEICLFAEIEINFEAMLKLLKKNNISPDKKLFDLMMLILGRTGSLNDCMTILNYMKKNDMILTDSVFSGLIMAYGFNRDLDGVQSIIDTIHSVQMEFTQAIYYALVTAYGVSGDFAKVNYIFRRMEEEKINLTYFQLKFLILDIVRSDQSGEDFKNLIYVTQLLLDKGDVDISKLILRLIHIGYTPEALQLLTSHRDVLNRAAIYENAFVFILEMFNSIKDSDLLINMCQQLERDGINDYALLVALQIALKETNEELAVALLTALKEEGKPLRQHYFWPLFSKRDSLTPSSVIEFVKTMVRLDISPDLETLKMFIIPPLLLENPNLTESMLSDAGLKISEIATPLVAVLIHNGKHEIAYDYVKGLKVKLSLEDLIKQAAKHYSSYPESAVSIMTYLLKSDKDVGVDGQKKDLGGLFLLNIESPYDLEEDQIVLLLQELKKNNIGISEESGYVFISRVNESIQSVVKDNVHTLISLDIGTPPNRKLRELHPKDMNVEELENHLVELESKKMNTRGVIRKLIIQYASQNKTSKVLRLMKDVGEKGNHISPGMLSALLGQLVKGRDASSAANVYEILKTFPRFEIDLYKVIDLCTLLIESDLILQALETLEDLPDKTNKKLSKSIRRNCHLLLMASAKTSDYSNTRFIFDLLEKKGMIAADNLMLGTLIKCHLVKGDLVSAVEEVENIEATYNYFPLKLEVVVNILKYHKEAVNIKDNSKSLDIKKLLEKVCSIIEKREGKLCVPKTILCAYLTNGYPDESTKILKAHGMNILRYARYDLEYFVETLSERPLLTLLKASLPVKNIDREIIYNYLLQIYTVQNDCQKGLKLWEQMKEEDVIPSQKFHQTLASLLRINKIKVPKDFDHSNSE